MVATETPGQTGGRDRRRNCGGEGLPSGPPRAPGSRWRWRVQPEGAGWGHGGVFGGWVSCMAPSPEEGRGAGMVWRGLGSAGPGLPGSLQIVSEENAEGPPARVQNRNRGLRAQLRPPAPLQVRWHVLTGCRALGGTGQGAVRDEGGVGPLPRGSPLPPSLTRLTRSGDCWQWRQRQPGPE